MNLAPLGDADDDNSSDTELREIVRDSLLCKKEVNANKSEVNAHLSSKTSCATEKCLKPSYWVTSHRMI